MTTMTLAAPSAEARAAMPSAHPPVGRLYDVAGRRLALDMAGRGGPTVVFLPGAGLVGLDFLNLHEAVRGFATSVIYDRGGTGWSDPVRLPRAAAEVARELHDLLKAAGAPGPYLLVGHSLGGAYARRFSQLFPAETAGVVYLDPAHEAYAAAPPQTLLAQARMGLKALPALLNARRFYRPMFERMYATWPAALRATLMEYHLRHWRRSLTEAANLGGEVLAEIGAGGPTTCPAIVLTAMGIDPFQAAFMDERYLRLVNQRKRDYYDALARAAPWGENRLVDAGHSTLQVDRPDAVVAAIRDLMERAAQPR
jgi:pimeloyl-ACP methyl ester carboxylesterase